MSSLSLSLSLTSSKLSFHLVCISRCTFTLSLSEMSCQNSFWRQHHIDMKWALHKNSSKIKASIQEGKHVNVGVFLILHNYLKRRHTWTLHDLTLFILELSSKKSKKISCKFKILLTSRVRKFLECNSSIFAKHFSAILSLNNFVPRKCHLTKWQ